MTFGVKFGALVKRYREAQGLSAGELAELALGDKAKRSRISELENGRVGRPHAKTIDALSNYLAIPLEEVDRCRSSQIENALSAELAKMLQAKFLEESPLATAAELEKFLHQSATDWKEIVGKLEQNKNTQKAPESLWQSVKDAIEIGDTQAADTALAAIEKLALTKLDADKAYALHEVNLVRADTELFLGNVEKAIQYAAQATDYLLAFKPQEALANLVEMNRHIVDKTTRFGWSHRYAAVNDFAARTLGLCSDPRFSFRSPSPGICAATMQRAVGLLKARKTGRKNYEEAVEIAEKALALCSTEEETRMALNAVGLAKGSLSSIATGKKRLNCLVDSVELLRQAAELSDSEANTESFVISNNNLGIAYDRLANYVEPEARVEVIMASGRAFTEAMNAVQQKPDLDLWIGTRNNMAASLLAWAKLVGGDVGVFHCNEASKICRESLQEFAYEDSPAFWIRTNITLISSLTNAAEFSTPDRAEAFADEAASVGSKLLNAKEVALDARARADVLSSRGNALRLSGAFGKMPFALEKLASARMCFEEAVDHLERSGSSAEIGSAINSMGVVWWEIARRHTGRQKFESAKQATIHFDRSLSVRTKKVSCVGWADTMNNKAATHVILAEESSAKRKEHLETALSCLNSALTVFTTEHGNRHKGTKRNLDFVSSLLRASSN